MRSRTLKKEKKGGEVRAVTDRRHQPRPEGRALTTGWKRLLLADGPRQSINALVLYSFAYSFGFQTHDIPAYWEHSAITAMLLFAQLATVLIFAGSLILLVAAALLYVPLLCYIQGNLKEYVCHKVDKVSLVSRKVDEKLMFSESPS
jgi:hypothetical protein